MLQQKSVNEHQNLQQKRSDEFNISSRKNDIIAATSAASSSSIVVAPTTNSSNLHVRRWGAQPTTPTPSASNSGCTSVACSRSSSSVSAPIFIPVSEHEYEHHSQFRQRCLLQEQEQQQQPEQEEQNHNFNYSSNNTTTQQQQRTTLSSSQILMSAPASSSVRLLFTTWRRRAELRRIFVPFVETNGFLFRVPSPLALLTISTFFQRWQNRALRVQRGREAIPELLRIQRNANFNLIEAYFEKWKEGARLFKLNRKLGLIQHKVNAELTARTFLNWHVSAKRLHNRRVALRALSSVNYVTQCVLMARYFFKLRRFPAERQRKREAAEDLALMNRQRYVTLTLWRWRRRMYLPNLFRQGGPLQHLRAYGRVLLLKRYFETWIKWSCRKMTALMLEQQNLRQLARVYFRQLRRHTHRARVAVPNLALIRQKSEKKLNSKAFRCWISWVERRVISLSLEQKTFILMLQRYYGIWLRMKFTSNSSSSLSLSSSVASSSVRAPSSSLERSMTTRSASSTSTTTTTTTTASSAASTSSSAYSYPPPLPSSSSSASAASSSSSSSSSLPREPSTSSTNSSSSSSAAPSVCYSSSCSPPTSSARSSEAYYSVSISHSSGRTGSSSSSSSSSSSAIEPRQLSLDSQREQQHYYSSSYNK